MFLTRTRTGQTTSPGFLLGPMLLCLLAFTACGGPQPIPLAPSYESKDAAVQAFLGALAARDRAALESMVITETEFKKYIWPELPSSAPDVGMPVDYVWGDTAQKNQGYLAQLLADHGGQRYELIAVSFAGETTDYGRFRVHRKTTLDLKGPKGAQTLKLFGSMIESDGHWKIYSFVVD